MEIRVPVSPEVLTAVSKLDHFRGAWAAGSLIPPERLARIAGAARIQSIAASCRIAGIKVTDSDVASALGGDAPPSHEVTQIRGYARAMDRGFPTDDPILTTDALRRFHALATGADGEPPGPSPWREEPYHLEFFDDQGHATGRIFQTLPPRLVPDQMEKLVTWLEMETRGGALHPVLVIGVFYLYLVASCPFPRANGRLAHLVIVHLLRRAGYDYMPYASLERVLEEMRDEYFEAMDAAETRLWSGEADLLPWVGFYLKALETHADRVREKLDLERRATEFSPLQQKIVKTVREHGTVAAGLLLEATGANRNTLKDNLRRLVDLGVLEKMGERRGTRYRLAGRDPSPGRTPNGPAGSTRASSTVTLPKV